jgi:plastocyanin
MRICAFRTVGLVVLAAASAGSARAQEAHEHQPAAAQSQTSSAQTKATSAEVRIDNFAFGPQTLTVPVGATVTWTNGDDIPHSVVSTDGAFKSKALDTDDKFSFTFGKAGTYSYFCGLHPKMTGKVVVQ